jgi:hypothetical protein
LIHDHYNSAGLEQNRILAWDQSCSSYLGLRSNAQISDIATLIRRDIFDTYRYKAEYAEDLDLGIRLIRDGHRLGFLHSTRVLHSHNRSSYYFLKRGYVDVRFLVEVFPNFVFPEVDDQSKLYRDILIMWQQVFQIYNELPNLGLPLPVKELTDHFLAMLSTSQAEPASADEGSSSDLREFMRSLSENCQMANSGSATKANMIRPHVTDHVERFQNWIRTIYDVADSRLALDIARALERIFALHSGTHLAYLYLTLRNRAKLDEALIAMDRTLTAGV